MLTSILKKITFKTLTLYSIILCTLIFSDSFKCANEKETCYCSGAVTYGKDSTWTDPKKVKKNIECNNDKFGAPPNKQPKECRCTMSGMSNKSFKSTHEYTIFLYTVAKHLPCSVMHKIELLKLQGRRVYLKNAGNTFHGHLTRVDLMKMGQSGMVIQKWKILLECH